MSCVRLLLSVMLSFMLMTSVVFGEPWSEKLGFPAGSTVVILQARELGVTWEFNEAAQDLLASGHVSSASVVATGPRFRDVARWRKANPNSDVGVSIALTNPYESLTWRLLTSEYGPTSLVDADGNPWKSAVQLAVSVNANDVKAELDAQIRRAREAGIKPTHITGYYGTLFSRADLTAVVLGASRKYWLPAPVVELTPELVDRFREEGYPVDDEMVELIRDYPLPKLDDLRMSPSGETFEQKRDHFCKMVKTLAPGLTLVILRPAEVSKGLQSLTEDWQQRVWDTQVLRDEKVAKVINDENVIVTNWQEIMQRFEGARPSEPTSNQDAEVK